MTQPQLDNLVRIGQLKTEPAAVEEIEGLVRSGTRRLIDAAREELSLESRFDSRLQRRACSGAGGP